FLEAFLRPGDIFVDVGANIGLFTVLGAQLVGKNGEVHSFEPYPPTFARLQENVALNGLGNVRCNRMGLSGTKGEADRTVSTDGFDAWNSLGRPYMGTALATKKVQVTTWDDYAQTHGLVGSVSLMKIDVEGWEAHVLEGGTNVLAREDAPTL